VIRAGFFVTCDGGHFGLVRAALSRAHQQPVERNMMRTHLRILTALVAVWLAVIALMALAPQAAGLRVVHADEAQVTRLDQQVTTPRSAFSHTGLWAAEVSADGRAVFVRDIRRN